jgi:hypothetical protein
LAGAGAAQIWDANTGHIRLIDGATAVGNGTVRLPLELERYETKFIVIGAMPPAPAARR